MCLISLSGESGKPPSDPLDRLILCLAVGRTLAPAWMECSCSLPLSLLPFPSHPLSACHCIGLGSRAAVPLVGLAPCAIATSTVAIKTHVLITPSLCLPLRSLGLLFFLRAAECASSPCLNGCPASYFLHTGGAARVTFVRVSLTGGTCMDLVNGFTCTCVDAFSGLFCQNVVNRVMFKLRYNYGREQV
jgi:hypothetical protein